MDLLVPLPITQDFHGSCPPNFPEPYGTPSNTRSAGIHLVGSRSQIPEIGITCLEELCPVPNTYRYCHYSTGIELVQTRGLVGETCRYISHIRCSARLAIPVSNKQFQLCTNQTRALKQTKTQKPKNQKTQKPKNINQCEIAAAVISNSNS